MTLDSAVSRAVAWAHLLETALHSQKPWFIDVGGVRMLATRTVHEWGVSFTACFPEVPLESTMAVLSEGNSMRAAREFTSPDEGGEFCLTWDLAMEETVPV